MDPLGTWSGSLLRRSNHLGRSRIEETPRPDRADRSILPAERSGSASAAAAGHRRHRASKLVGLCLSGPCRRHDRRGAAVCARLGAMARVLLIVGGGIAAYKSLELVRLLKKEAHEVTLVLTKGGE